MKTPDIKRNLQLDVLRVVAVLLVLGQHSVPCPETYSAWGHMIVNILKRGGWIGVDIFFVLSGFLVSGLLFREYQRHGNISLSNFLIRRGFKIYPAFWVFIAVTVAWILWRHGTVSIPTLFSELLFVQNYFTFGFWGHTWTLAVEEHFYIIIVVMLFVLSRTAHSAKDPFRILIFIFPAVALVCGTFRTITALSIPFSPATHIAGTHLRIDSLLFGALLSYAWHFRPENFQAWCRTYRVSLLIVGTLLLVPAFIWPLQTTWWIPAFGIAAFYLGAGALLLGLLVTDLGTGWIVRTMAALGARSYSIYLWHMPFAMLWYGKRVINPVNESWSWLMEFSLYVGITFLVGLVTTSLIEYPMLRLRDHLCPTRSGGLRIKQP